MLKCNCLLHPEFCIILLGGCNFLSLSHHNKNLKRQKLKASACHSSHTVLQLCVTAQFYLENKGKYILQPWGHTNPKDTKRRERVRARVWDETPGPLAPLGICFLLPLGLHYVSWASQECCLFYLRSLLWSSDLPLTLLCSIFAGFSLPCLLATAILDSFFLFYLPNNYN